MDTLEGPRKRLRSEIVDSDTYATGSFHVGNASEGPVVRDETYYRENGDCIIRVGRVLFKIHRILLDRDGSAFANMFSMPQGSESIQETTDENSLVLFDDVDDFRALCWIIYALPTVHLKQIRTATANMANLVSLCVIAHKYHFESHEIFARSLLRVHCSFLCVDPSGENYFFTCSEDRLKSLLQIATLTDPPSPTSSPSFSSLLEKIWMLRLEKTNESAAFALEVAEALGLRSFATELYYLELTRMKPVHLIGSTAYAHPSNNLTSHQKLVLFQGHWSLQNYWSNVREEVINRKFDGCRHVDCEFAWRRSWERCRVNEARSPNFHPLQMLANIETIIRGFARSQDFQENIECALAFIRKMQADLKESLADHFLGPASQPDAVLPS